MVGRRRIEMAGLLALCSAAARAQLYGASSAVASLHPYQLDAIRADQHRTWVLEAYASWCGHCQAFAPTYEALAANLSSWTESVTIGAIDCATYTDACLGLGVTGFPTLFVWRPNAVGGGSERAAADGAAAPSARNASGGGGGVGASADVADGDGISTDGSPMHVGGFESAAELASWLLPKLPSLFQSVTDRAAAARVLGGARTRRVPAVLFWPETLGANIDAQQLAYRFGRRAAFAHVVDPAHPGLLEALALPPGAAPRVSTARGAHVAAAAATTTTLEPALFVLPVESLPAILNDGSAPAPAATAASPAAAVSHRAPAPDRRSRRRLASRANVALGGADDSALTASRSGLLAVEKAASRTRAAVPPTDAAASPAGGGAVTRGAADTPAYLEYVGGFTAGPRPIEVWLDTHLPPPAASATAGGTSATNASGGHGGSWSFSDDDNDGDDAAQDGDGAVPVSMADLTAAVEYAFESEVPLAIAGAAGGALGAEPLAALDAFLAALASSFPAAENRAVLERARHKLARVRARGANLTVGVWRAALGANDGGGRFHLPSPPVAGAGASRGAARARVVAVLSLIHI